MIAITLDVDWSPDPIVDRVMSLFEDARVPVTLFCTDPGTDSSGVSSPLGGRYHDRHEIALHPNFDGRVDHEAVLRRLLAHYPRARGFRSHNGWTGWPIDCVAAKLGLAYEVQVLVFPIDVPPLRLGEPAGFTIFVNRFMDAHLLHAARREWSLADLGLPRDGGADDSLFIANFHPNIIYYDMLTVDDYLRHRPYYHEPREANSFLNKPARGPVKLIGELLAAVDRENFVTIDAFGRNRGLWS